MVKNPSLKKGNNTKKKNHDDFGKHFFNRMKYNTK